MARHSLRELGNLATVYQMVHALGEGRPLGRRTLVRATGITESTVRTHLNKLRGAGLVKMGKSGTTLTSAGVEAFETLFQRIGPVVELDLTELALDRHNAAAPLRQGEGALRGSWRYRDAAVREGATGALLLVKHAHGWTLSDDVIPLADRNSRDEAAISRALAARDGDGLAISFGPSRTMAMFGLWRLITELVPPEDLALQKILQRS